MKNSTRLIVVFSALALVAGPVCYGDGIQKDTPGAQGTQGTNPTHQDQDVTGPNGEHPNATSPTNAPANHQ